MRSKAFAIGLCLLGFVATAFAQHELAFDVLNAHPGTSDSTPSTLHRRVAEIAVTLAVTDRNGKPVVEISRDDLQILDDGKPATITQIRREDELPLRLALVVDWSDSMRKDFGFERKVALDFLRAALRPNTDRAMVVGFRYRVEVTQSLSGDLQLLEAGLRPVGGVPLSSVYDALIAATDALRNADPGLPQRRAIVLLSDGDDNVSAHAWSDVIEAAERSNITIYTIAPRRRRANPRGEQVLAKLASVTGGRAFFIPPTREQPAFDAIQQSLRLRYSVYFKPGIVGGDRYRMLEITPRDRNLQVWARHGYYVDWE